jgi:hypothetical protein
VAWLVESGAVVATVATVAVVAVVAVVAKSGMGKLLRNNLCRRLRGVARVAKGGAGKIITEQLFSRNGLGVARVARVACCTSARLRALVQYVRKVISENVRWENNIASRKLRLRVACKAT